jgi:hypothetical protein
MCQASKVTNDWVVKGCHIHIEAVELNIFPDHKGGFGFKPVFAVTTRNRKAVDDALRVVREKCLPDPEVRERWIRDLDHAITCMLSIRGQLSALANGRMLEFKFLMIALER